MSEQENATMVRRIYDEGWNAGNLHVIDEICAPFYTGFDPQNLPYQDRDGLKQTIMGYRSAFPDVHFTIDDMITPGDMVVTRWTATGTQRGPLPLPNLPVTGKTARVTGIGISRMENGKIVQDWTNWDTLDMLQ